MECYEIKELGVSTTNYTTKPIFKNVRYSIKKNIEMNEMIKLIRQGYSFTHSFHVDGEFGNTEKTIKKFKETNYIWFDFDDCEDSLSTIFQELTYKPNTAYTTISNLKNGKLNRFRLIYILDFSIYSNENYKYYLNLLLNTIIKDLGKDYLKYIDKNCFNVSQQMFGSNKDSIIISNDTIYSKKVFENIIKTYNIDYSLIKNKCSKKLKSNNLEKEKKILKQSEDITTSVSELIDLLRATDIRKYYPTLTNEHLAILTNEDVYTDVSDQDIYKINFLYDKNKKIQKIKRGYRNNMLFTLGITIRNINPMISLEELVKSLYWLYIHRCEKSDDFDISQVCTIAINVFKTDTEDYQELGKRKYLIHPDYKHLPRSEKSKELGKSRRKTRDNNILPNYNFSKSPKENAVELGVSENTIRNSLKENDIKTPNQEKYDRFIEIYNINPNASIRQLSKLTGFADKTVQSYKKKYEGSLLEKF